MRGTKAKQLRRDAEFRAGVISTTYQDKVVKREVVPTKRLDKDGLPVMIEFKGEQVPEFLLLDKITTSMVSCTRKTYKQLKRNYLHG